MNPIDPNTGTNFRPTFGQAYTWTFQTVVHLNGNHVYNSGLAADIPGLVWQMHSYGGSDACTSLVIGNTYVAYVNGISKYGTVAPGGQPIWNFHDCSNGDYGTGAYNSPDTLTEGEVDNWKFNITPVQLGQTGGLLKVYRNGAQVYSTNGAACGNDVPSSNGCFWNFGPYMFFWKNTSEPSGWSAAGITVNINGMTLQKGTY
jgi:hypothetical protein